MEWTRFQHSGVDGAVSLCYIIAPMGQQLRARVKRKARLRQLKRKKIAAKANAKAKPVAPAAIQPTA